MTMSQKDNSPFSDPQYASSRTGNHVPWNKYRINRHERIPCLEHKVPTSFLQPERENKSFESRHEHQSLASETTFMSRESLPTVRSSPVGNISDVSSKSVRRIQPKIIGRVMSEIHSNVASKQFSSEDFVNILVERVIAEVANEMNIHDDDYPRIYPVLAQTSILPQDEKSEVLLSDHIYEDPSEQSIDHDQDDVSPKPTKSLEDLRTEKKTEVSAFSERTSLEREPPPNRKHRFSSRQQEGKWHKYFHKAIALVKKFSCTFWVTLLYILLALFIMSMAITLGALLGISICSPRGCPPSWTTSLFLRLLFVSQPSEPANKLYGVF